MDQYEAEAAKLERAQSIREKICSTKNRKTFWLSPFERRVAWEIKLLRTKSTTYKKPVSV